MAASEEKKGRGLDADDLRSSESIPEGPGFPVPEVMRRMLAMGLSSLFVTQESIRQIVGDALPREWVDFATQQSERTRAEFLERLAGEMSRVLETTDLSQILGQLLEGRTIEVNARIRLEPRDADAEQSEGVRFSVVGDSKK